MVNILNFFLTKIEGRSLLHITNIHLQILAVKNFNHGSAQLIILGIPYVGSYILLYWTQKH